MTIGERIKSLRETHEMSQEELGSAIGTTKQTIFKYENNIITNIPLDKIERIAKLLSVSPGYLMGWETQNFLSSEDPDIRRIERARTKMSPQDKEKMMNILRASFDEYFSDNYDDGDVDE